MILVNENPHVEKAGELLNVILYGKILTTFEGVL